MIVCPHCKKTLEPDVPDTVEELLRAQLDESVLVQQTRSFLEQAEVALESRGALDMTFQFAVDTYREWAQLDLHAPAVLDASLMALVHVRNALRVNGAWHPEGADVASRVVFVMLRFLAEERVRQL
jgi:hypothetical protein